jgi:hypothetical protein
LNAVVEYFRTRCSDVRANTVGHTFERIAAKLEARCNVEKSLVASNRSVQEEETVFDLLDDVDIRTNIRNYKKSRCQIKFLTIDSRLKKLTCANFVNVGEVAVLEHGEFEILPSSGNWNLRFFNSESALIPNEVHPGFIEFVA